MRERVLLFLGAGSSEPLSVPTNKDFVTEFLQHHPSHTDLWNKIRARIEAAGYTRPIDLEAAMTMLDALSSDDPLDYLENAAGPIPAFYLGGVESEIQKLASPFSSEAAAMAKAMRLYVRQRCESPNFGAAKNVFDPLMGALSGNWRIRSDIIGVNPRKTPLNVMYPEFDCFTTNYDLTFEYYCKRDLRIPIRNGFVERQGEVTFSVDQVRNTDAAFSVFHIHGSVQMVRMRDGRIIPTPMYAPGQTLTSGGEEIEEEAMIYPILEKQLTRYPFPDMFAGLSDRIREYPVVVFVGFSFRDDPVLRLLWDSSHSNQKVVIVSRTARELVPKIRSRLRSQIAAAPVRLGEPQANGLISQTRDEEIT